MTAVLVGDETVSLFGVTYRHIQKFTLVKTSGTGVAGAWTGTEWDYKVVAPRPSHPAFAAEIAKSPTQIIPGAEAACDTSLVDNKTVRFLCKGAFPFVVAANGDLRWKGGSDVIGKVTRGTAGGPATMSLSIFPKTPFFDGTVKGPINAAGKFNFSVKVSDERRGGAPWSEFGLTFTLDPPAAVDPGTIGATLAYSGSLVSPTWKTAPADKSVTVTVRFEGSPSQRSIDAAASAITVGAKVDGCAYSSTFNISEILLATGKVP